MLAQTNERRSPHTMREMPDLWRGPARIQFGCVLMNMLGEDSLQHLHVVLAGFRSVEQSRQVAPYQQAVRTARMLLGNLQTKQSVLQAVYTFCDWALETGTRSGQTGQSVEHI